MATKVTNRKLTHKQQIFVKHLIDNPKASGTEAALMAYNTDRVTAATISTENLRKPQIVSKLAEYNDLVENTLLNTVSEWGDNESVSKRALAIDTSKFIHDKIHGKSKQQLDISSVALNLNLDLTSALTDDNKNVVDVVNE